MMKIDTMQFDVIIQAGQSNAEGMGQCAHRARAAGRNPTLSEKALPFSKV